MPTDISAPLPALLVAEGTTYTVTCDDANAVITQLVVHGNQTEGPDIETLTLQDVYLTPKTADVINPADYGGPVG